MKRARCQSWVDRFKMKTTETEKMLQERNGLLEEENENFKENLKEAMEKIHELILENDKLKENLRAAKWHAEFADDGGFW